MHTLRQSYRRGDRDGSPIDVARECFLQLKLIQPVLSRTPCLVRPEQFSDGCEEGAQLTLSGLVPSRTILNQVGR
jgi:hypothetical protein